VPRSLNNVTVARFLLYHTVQEWNAVVKKSLDCQIVVDCTEDCRMFATASKKEKRALWNGTVEWNGGMEWWNGIVE